METNQKFRTVVRRNGDVERGIVHIGHVQRVLVARNKSGTVHVEWKAADKDGFHLAQFHSKALAVDAVTSAHRHQETQS